MVLQVFLKTIKVYWKTVDFQGIFKQDECYPIKFYRVVYGCLERVFMGFSGPWFRAKLLFRRDKQSRAADFRARIISDFDKSRFSNVRVQIRGCGSACLCRTKYYTGSR